MQAYVGRTYRDAPNVDGFVFVNTTANLMSGAIVRVEITGAMEYDLIGSLVAGLRDAALKSLRNGVMVRK